MTMALWWSDIVTESRTPGVHSPVVRLGLRYGMFMFIASEVMFFVAFFWAFFHFALYPEHASSETWPPQGVQVFDPWDLPFLNTLILLTSGTTVTWAHHGLREGNRKALVYGLALTVALGIAFTACQAYEYSHAAFGFKDGVYSSTFFMATGFHGFHVIVGTIFLTVCLIRALKGHCVLSWVLKYRANRWVNIIAGTLFVVTQISSLFIGAQSPAYIFYSTIEIAGLLLIVGYAWKWRNPEGQPVYPSARAN